MKVMATLIRREFWEHRTLVFVPLALCALYLGTLIVMAVVNLNSDVVTFGSKSLTSAGVLILMHTVFTALLYGIMAIVAFFYVCDCLYAERKDRSILFWKSMPVSDTMTVLSKAIVALIAVPVVVYVLSLVTNIVAFVLIKLLFHPASPSAVAAGWTFGAWIKVNGYLILDILVLALWFAPVTAYQLLVSAVAPRAVFVYTVLPPLTLTIGEWLFFRTRHIADFLAYRLGNVNLLSHTGRNVDDVIRLVNATPLLTKPGLWIGVALAAAGIYVTIRIRRHQQDS